MWQVLILGKTRETAIPCHHSIDMTCRAPNCCYWSVNSQTTFPSYWFSNTMGAILFVKPLNLCYLVVKITTLSSYYMELNALKTWFINPCIMHLGLVKLLHFTEEQVNLENFIISLIYLKILQHRQCDIHFWYIVLFYSLEWLVTREVSIWENTPELINTLKD